MADPALSAAVADWLRARPGPVPPPTSPAQLAQARRAAARARHAADPLAFAAELLPLHFSLPVAPAPFHADMLGTFARLREEGAAGRSVREVYEAPRSWAKSTYAATLLPLLAACLPEVYGLRYVVLCRARHGLAEEDVDGVRRLLDGDLVRGVYGAQEGPTWNRGLIVTAGGVRIQAMGLDQANRGLRDPATGDRPDLVIIDDPDKDAQGPGVRRKLRDNIKGALLGMQGAAGRPMHIICVGTVVDSRATVRWLREQPGFRHRTYRAIGAWPDEIDGLWREWERLWLSDDEAGPALAADYYDARRAAMDAGATGLWGGDPLPRVMEARLVMGAARFAAEKLNDPRGGDDALIDPARITWFDPAGAAVRWTPPEGGALREAPVPPIVRAVVVLDPATGLSDGDHHAIVGGWRTMDGRRWAVVGELTRTPDGAALAARCLDACEAVGAGELLYEAVGGFRWVRPSLEAERARRGSPVAIREIPAHRVGKAQRLQNLAPALHGGMLLLGRAFGGEALAQLLSLRQDGTGGDHDDGPDVLEMFDAALARPSLSMPAHALSADTGRREPRAAAIAPAAGSVQAGPGARRMRPGMRF